jgi:hypothetical protein
LFERSITRAELQSASISESEVGLGREARALFSERDRVVIRRFRRGRLSAREVKA